MEITALACSSPATQVAIVWWPEEAAGVAGLRAAGVPRLLLVAPDAAVPNGGRGDEDWIRRPASDDDLRARVHALAQRCANRPASAPTTGLGRIHYRGKWVPLSDTEQALAQALADRFGDVVGVPDLLCAGGRSLSDGGVRVHLTRLRKRIRPLGLIVRAVRGRGYVLDDEEHSPRPAR